MDSKTLRSYLPLIASFVAGYALAGSYSPDIGYKLRQLRIDLFTREIPDEAKVDKNGVTIMGPSRVMPGDVDHNSHMNNAVYIRELCFSRRYHLTALGLWRVLNLHALNVIVACQTIRYRKELRLWQEYSIRTKIIGYSDTQSVFWLQSQFENPAGQILAVHIVKYKLISRVGNAHQGAVRTYCPSELLIEVGLRSLVPEANVDVPGNVPQVDAVANMNVLHQI